MSVRLLTILALFTATSLGMTARVALTASNGVPPSSAGFHARAQGVNDFKPSFCSGVTLTNLVTGSGTFAGTAGADLILGSAGADVISAGSGEDCVLGGGGDDTVSGEAGADVLSGGPGTDVCEGGTEVDSFPLGDCETANQ